MKLGVTTLGCPNWTLAEILARCRSYGYNGIELRGLGPDLDLAQSPAFATPAAIQESRKAADDAGMEICGIDSSARMSDAEAGTWAGHRDHAQQMMTLAEGLGAPFVRVFGGDGPAPVTLVAERLRQLGDFAAQTGNVTVVLETHDAYSTGAQVAQAVSLADHPHVGALWDLHHPFRHGETPQQTWDAIGPYVRQTHVKDSIPGGTYCLLGDGDLPIKEMLSLLVRGGYDGWVNLEWEKRWIPALAELGA
jgi:sugar phosphate isomerase/epimerase